MNCKEEGIKVTNPSENKEKKKHKQLKIGFDQNDTVFVAKKKRRKKICFMLYVSMVVGIISFRVIKPLFEPHIKIYT